jgi:hypothetical protein
MLLAPTVPCRNSRQSRGLSSCVYIRTRKLMIALSVNHNSNSGSSKPVSNPCSPHQRIRRATQTAKSHHILVAFPAISIQSRAPVLQLQAANQMRWREWLSISVCESRCKKHLQRTSRNPILPILAAAVRDMVHAIS